MTHAITIELTFRNAQGYEYIDASCMTLEEVNRTISANATHGWVCTKRAIVVYEEQGEGLFSDNYMAPTEIARRSI